jgi:hypothetical protein
MYRRRAHGIRRTAELRGPGDGYSPGTWNPGAGRFWKRQLHKAERRWARGYGRFRSVVHRISVVCWKDS